MTTDYNTTLRTPSPTGRYREDLIGLSSDEKPDATGNGSSFLEMDTGKVFLFDEESGAWREV